MYSFAQADRRRQQDEAVSVRARAAMHGIGMAISSRSPQGRNVNLEEEVSMSSRSTVVRIFLR